MKKIMKVSLLLTVISCVLANTAFAGTTKQAASSMHYGMPMVLNAESKTQGYGPIVITNCSYQMDIVSAWFVNGSFNTMPIYPVTAYPRNVISIDDPYPYVNIEVDAFDGTILFPEQPVYPGQDVNIGCGANVKTLTAKPVVTISGSVEK